MGINKLRPAAAEQQGAGVSPGALVGTPLPPCVKTLPDTLPVQNVALNPVVIPLVWKRFECGTRTVARGGGRGWDRGLVSFLNPLSCCLASILWSKAVQTHPPWQTPTNCNWGPLWGWASIPEPNGSPAATRLG